MTPRRFLDYEVALLLAKHGKEAVLGTLASKLGLAPPELESLLRGIDEEKPVRRERAPAFSVDQIEDLVAQNPQKAEQLRVLHTRFLNRTFLPELRDVRRFFEQHSRSLGHTKSRAQSLPKVMRLLADLDRAELDALCEARQPVEYSSLGIISDEILRRDR